MAHQVHLAKSAGEPDRIRKQTDSVQRAASNLQAEVGMVAALPSAII